MTTRIQGDASLTAALTTIDTRQSSTLDTRTKYDQEAPRTLPDGTVLEVHVYDGPKGVGFEVIATVEDRGKTYKRSRHVGPETHRGYGWAEVVPITTDGRG